MGTRSLTVFSHQDGVEIAVMYRQMDGYPSGHGMDLKYFLEDMHIVNGFNFNDERKIANGMDCLAAQVIAHFKDGVGGFYLMPAGTRNVGEEYVYELSPGEDGKVHLRGISVYRNHVFYDGPIAEFELGDETEE